ncbi:MAG: Na(+)/H(+) antiporter subunit D [Gemmatimonadetes bacterium]|nr:Na(+)/H(+) antiporter subunit D [Gemmatimonadota bacterium]
MSSFLAGLPPASIIIVGALLVPLLKGRARAAFVLLLPILSGVQLLGFFGLPEGAQLQIDLLGYTLTLNRIDKLSLVFGLIFHIVALLTVIYALHVKDAVQHMAGLVYASAGIAAVFAGDLITLFVYWELTAIASVFLIWARKTEAAYRSGMRYLIIQVGSGVLLLAGTIVHYQATGSLAFDHLGLGTTGTNLIFLAFGIKCAFPLLHNWLQDAYPQATVTGTVFLSAFTTKLAVYALARGYAGTEILIPIGVIMTIFPIFFAVIENDLRKVLAYSLNNQLGFMVVGVGIGTELALNGTVSHAFAHLLYKALLFMSMGAVLYRVGTIKASELGGLYKSMPFTTIFCIIGAMSISAFPLFSGFVTKSMIISAAGYEHLMWAFLGLTFASAGVMEHSGIKIPFFAFFAHDSGLRPKEAPLNMLVAMGGAAALCILIGVFPGPLYALLPYDAEYHPYTTAHVVTSLQLLLWAALAFAVLMRTGLYPAETRSTNLDTDWVYRRGLPRLIGVVAIGVRAAYRAVTGATNMAVGGVLGRVSRHHKGHGVFARTWATGSSVLWVAGLLAAFLVMYYLR